MEKITYNEMELMVPDYVFGNLDQSDKELFEFNLRFYPEIEDEVNEVSSVFKKVEQIDINKIMKDKSKNVSVKVIDQLHKPKFNLLSFIMKPKNLMPTLGLVAMVYIFFFTDQFNNNISNSSNNHISSNIFTNSELVVIDSYIDEDVSDDIVDMIDLNAYLDESIEDISYIDDLDILTIDNSFEGTENSYDELLDQITEDEFQEVLKDLSNEDFNI